MNGVRRALTVATLALLAACQGAAYRDLHFTQPSEYYFYYPDPETIRGAPPLLIALMGKGRGPAACIDLFHQFAVDGKYALLCPALGGRFGVGDSLQAEADLAAILTQLYQTHTFADRFFLAGFGDGGSFALSYALKYPGAVSGVSAMSVETYPEGPFTRADLPIQLLVGESDADGLSVADQQAELLRTGGNLVRVVSVAGNGRSPTLGFARLASELVQEVHR
jgi:pimeloyl-ACP methyl ester carboxylesterase